MTGQNTKENLKLTPDLNAATGTTRTASSSGFTLVELTVVVLILGILAAIAVPKVFYETNSAVDNGLRQTLRTIRSAIDMYAAQNGGVLPGATLGTQASFKNELRPYLRKQFPAGPLGPATGDDRVKILNDGDPLSGVTSPNKAWKYDSATGQFIYNYNGISSDGVTTYDEF